MPDTVKKSTAQCTAPHFHEEEVKLALSQLPPDDEAFELADMFKLLSDTSRLKIIFALMDNELCVCDICHVVGMNQSAISHQLRFLKAAHLVKYRRSGKLVYYSIDDSHVSSIIQLARVHLSHTLGE